MLVHIVSHLQHLKVTRSPFFGAYFRTLILIVHQLKQQQYPLQSLEQIYQAICSQLFPHLSDLTNFRRYLNPQSLISTEGILYSKVMAHVKPRTPAEHL